MIMEWHGTLQLNGRVNFQEGDDLIDTNQSFQKSIYPS